MAFSRQLHWLPSGLRLNARIAFGVYHARASAQGTPHEPANIEDR